MLLDFFTPLIDEILMIELEWAGEDLFASSGRNATDTKYMAETLVSKVAA